MVSVIISAFAMVVSVTTLWLTFFYSGQLKMTHPSVIYFGADQDKRKLKIFGALFYSTSKRRQVIEHAYIKVTRNKVSQVFDMGIWRRRTEA